MEAVFIVLNKPELIKDVLSLFLDYEIHGATVLDSAGMGHLIANQTPMFSMFAGLSNAEEDNSKTIFTIVKNDHERDLALNALEQVVGDLSEPDSAILFTVPVGFQKGLGDMGNE